MRASHHLAALLAAALLLPAPAPAGDALPAAVDLRPKFEAWGLAVRGQADRPTCSVFTVVAAIEYAVARARGRGEPMSVEFANWAANRACGHADDGSFFHDVWKGYEESGISPARASRGSRLRRLRPA